MLNYLVLPHREVVEFTCLCKTVGLWIMPYFVTQVSFIKMDVKNTNLCARLVRNTEVFLFYTINLKAIEDILGEHIADQSGIIKRCGLLFHDVKVQIMYRMMKIFG